jgi:hypothetical protein
MHSCIHTHIHTGGDTEPRTESKFACKDLIEAGCDQYQGAHTLPDGTWTCEMANPGKGWERRAGKSTGGKVEVFYWLRYPRLSVKEGKAGDLQDESAGGCFPALLESVQDVKKYLAMNIACEFVEADFNFDCAGPWFPGMKEAEEEPKGGDGARATREVKATEKQQHGFIGLPVTRESDGVVGTVKRCDACGFFPSFFLFFF